MLIYTRKQLAAMRRRMVAGGLYYGRGSAELGYLNAPADGERIIEQAAIFMVEPIWAGTGHSAPPYASVFIGYSSGIPDTATEYPSQQLEMAKSAALLYALFPDEHEAEGLKVCQVLLDQVAIATLDDDQSLSTYLPNWDHPVNRKTQGLAIKYDVTLTIDQGTQEAGWITRFIYTYELVRPLLTTEQDTLIRAWILGQITWLAQREMGIANWATALYPGLLEGDFSEKGYLASPTFPNPFVVANPAIEREAPYASAEDTGGILHTHRYSDGTLGHPIAKAHTLVGNNRFSIRMQAVLYGGYVLEDAYCKNVGKQCCKLFLVNCVYPDGITAEWARNGDYQVPAEGALAYQTHNSGLVLLGCWLGYVTADRELINYATREGCHGTEVAAEEPPKTFDIVFDRMVALSITGLEADESSLYWAEVDEANRITEQVAARTVNGEMQRAEFLPIGRYQLFWAYLFWPKPDYRSAARGELAGQIPMPVGSSELGFRSNGSIPYAFEGPFAEYACFHLAFADMPASVLSSARPLC